MTISLGTHFFFIFFPKIAMIGPTLDFLQNETVATKKKK
jgi:hypothetical protein